MISKNIKYYRLMKSMSKKDLANAINVTPMAISNYESGKRTIPIQHLITLAKYYNTSIDYIVGLINIENNKKHIS